MIQNNVKQNSQVVEFPKFYDILYVVNEWEEVFMMDVNHFKEELVSLIADWNEVLGIGQTGDINAPLIPGNSDIDLFVICKTVPSKEWRREAYQKLAGKYEELQMEACAGGVWGYGDIFLVNGIDVMPMYFSINEMKGYIEEVLAGKHLSKDGRFYPIGRLASIETLTVLYEEKRSWSDIIDLVKDHPASLFEKWYESEASRIIDEEDLGRAELRHEILFYHQVVEEFLDHFLQALYAKNNCYFPSRKRTEAAIQGFDRKPEKCYERLLKVVMLGSQENTIEDSIQEIRALAKELKELPWG